MNKFDFEFSCPTKIYFRENGVGTIGDIISKNYGFTKVFLIYGGESIKKYGTYSKVIESLNRNGIIHEEYSGIQANPDIEDVIKMVEQTRKFKPDLLLAVGGGSVLDAAKSVAHGYYYDGNPLDFNKHLVKPLHALKVATILTLAASGSEMSDSCVISDRKHHFKSGFNSVTNYPLFSLMDPTLTMTVPLYQRGVGLADMFSHAMERYFSPSSVLEPCDDIALAIMKNIVECSKAIIAKPDDLLANRTMMICGTLAHDGFANYGKNKVFIVHKAEHKLSGYYPELLHGQGIALLMPLYLKTNEKLFEKKITRLGTSVFSLDKECSCEQAIKALEDYLDTLPIYHSFEELPFEVSKEVIDKAVSVLKITDK